MNITNTDIQKYTITNYIKQCDNREIVIRINFVFSKIEVHKSKISIIFNNSKCFHPYNIDFFKQNYLQIITS